MGPTIFRSGGFRFYFFSREERRIQVHVHRSNGEAKFWLEPKTQNYGLSSRQQSTALRLIREHEDEIRAACKVHFGR